MGSLRKDRRHVPAARKNVGALGPSGVIPKSGALKLPISWVLAFIRHRFGYQPMRTCRICQENFEDNERVIFNSRISFVCKPAHVLDTVNAAKVSPEELAESRKEYTRTEVATHFVDWKNNLELPTESWNFRHEFCEPSRTGAGPSGSHPRSKHHLRYARGIARKGSK